MSTALSASTAILSSQTYKNTPRSPCTQRIILGSIETDIASAGSIKNGWYPKEIASLSHLPPTQKEGMNISSYTTVVQSLLYLNLVLAHIIHSVIFSNRFAGNASMAGECVRVMLAILSSSTALEKVL